jgi:hypothetical protein
LIQRLGTTQALDVFGDFFFKDVYHVVYGDDTEEDTVVVYRAMNRSM